MKVPERATSKMPHEGNPDMIKLCPLSTLMPRQGYPFSHLTMEHKRCAANELSKDMGSPAGASEG